MKDCFQKGIDIYKCKCKMKNIYIYKYLCYNIIKEKEGVNDECFV